ncbi:salicylate hydroxylase [Acrodontium crateriforme]|uniref:Salicylate hydroxylase n=1 Tax=Acrodontium crateriforme TaxID=150365 RepID=A0AAQ3M7P0_9PEZI|nr:salicylate hydroxylase [Acrodontium crateriforme]
MQSHGLWQRFHGYAGGRRSPVKIVLIGDAAHGTLHSLAQGAAMATEDAGALAECIRRIKPKEDIPEAMRLYERSRKWRCESSCLPTKELILALQWMPNSPSGFIPTISLIRRTKFWTRLACELDAGFAHAIPR